MSVKSKERSAERDGVNSSRCIKSSFRRRSRIGRVIRHFVSSEGRFYAAKGVHSLALCFALLLAGCSKPSPPPVAHKGIGDLSVTLTAGSPPHVGDNTFSVTLANSYTQAPIGNANITAIPQMLSHSGTGSPSSGRSQGNGLYQIPVRFGVATRYDINLHIERPGSPPADVSFPVEAAQ